MKLNADKWVRNKFEHRNAGRDELSICCPMCDDKRFRLYICTDPKQETKSGNIFPCYCHNEQLAYSLADIYSVIENVHILEAKRIIDGTADDVPYCVFDELLDLLLDKKEEKKEIVKVEQKIFLPKTYVPLYNIDRNKWETIVPSYVKNRNVTYEMCSRYQLGFTQETGNMWANRLIIPIYLDGTLITYQGRSMFQTKEQKYVFKKIQDESIKIGDCLYNIDNIDLDNKSLILVEGVFDVWAVVKAGYNNCVASFGKHLTEKALNRIIRDFNKIYILWDRDAKVEVQNLVDRLRCYIDVYVVDLNGKDPDESSSEEIITSIETSRLYSYDTFFNDLMVMLEDECRK